MTTDKLKCVLCDRMVLPVTAAANAGLCAQCVKLSPATRSLRRSIKEGLDPLEHAINLYYSHIDTLVKEFAYGNFCALGDALFTSVRFFTFDKLTGCFDYNESTELGSEAVDEIEIYLSEVHTDFSVFTPILTKLLSVSPILNSDGKTVFLGSWGMGPGEIAGLIRFLNDRPTFDRYLEETGITEEEVDVYNRAYAEEPTEAIQAGSYDGDQPSK
jgi:hypothetical protein